MTTQTTTLLAEAGKQEIRITREFDAPRELVFQAFTDPKLITQWWGPRHLSTHVETMDVRPGEDNGDFSIEMLREMNTRFMVFIMLSHVSHQLGEVLRFSL